ncbi:hypothetical protein LDG_7841 [Legionella drancourtii LLAP12]|uniref:Uncharacterized protein n=1 Tax=Legionella drancourtii LLAP12 TaxID=658187 RepID=G9ERC9_9GAMM|nr:hypothetical protein LDG_7841 [Legionella drancourtii LLAP12]
MPLNIAKAVKPLASYKIKRRFLKSNRLFYILKIVRQQSNNAPELNSVFVEETGAIL